MIKNDEKHALNILVHLLSLVHDIGMMINQYKISYRYIYNYIYIDCKRM